MQESIEYESENYLINSYSTSSGMQTEFTLKKFPDNNTMSFWIETELSLEQVDEGYILLKDLELDEFAQIQGIIHSPIIICELAKDEYQFLYDNKLQFECEKGNRYLITISLDKKLSNYNQNISIKADMSWEMYRSTQPDSAIYSKRSHTNRYLANYSLIGESDMYGVGENYMRLRIGEYIKDTSDNIKSAYISFYEASGQKSPSQISLYKISQQWSSTRITWDNKIGGDNKIDQKKVNERGYYSFNITDVAKECLKDDTMEIESNGISLVAENSADAYRLFASSDNALFSPFEEITFFNLPTAFNPVKRN